MIIPCENCGKKYVELEDVLCESCSDEMDEIEAQHYAERAERDAEDVKNLW